MKRHFYLLLLCNFLTSLSLAQQITVIGTGYVGLIAGTGLAQIGHNIVCFDVDREKIDLLNKNIIPIYEMGIEEMVEKNVQAGRLSFTADPKTAIDFGEIIIVAVGTPSNDMGDSDLSFLYSTIEIILTYAKKSKLICIKSTVPVGTNEKIKNLLQQPAAKINFDIVSNPEFLREGSALKDFFECNPIILGSESQEALQRMKDIYKPLIDAGTPLLTTNLVTAETIKYAWNTFSATRITFVNELAYFCSAVGADIENVVEGMSYSTQLLPSKALRPGPGIGGSCLPKDCQAFTRIAYKKDVDLSVINAVIKANIDLKYKVVQKLSELFDHDLQGKQIAILGLAFKANTDDVRYSPAIIAIEELLKHGAIVRAYDPKANSNMKKILPDVAYYNSWQEACEGVDGILVLTEWQEFKNINLENLAPLLKQKIVMDARNIWSVAMLKKLGFKFANLGKL